MPSSEQDRAVQQSLLDRLIDLDPASEIEPPLSRPESLRRLRASVQRDLEWLFNTVRATEVPAGLVELKKSLYIYGVPDISHMSLDSAQDEQRILRALESAIAQAEPRLANVRVTAPEKISRKKMYIQFHIDALLLIDPLPEHLSFDTVFEVARGVYKITEQ